MFDDEDDLEALPHREVMNPVASAAREQGCDAKKIWGDETRHSRGDSTRFKRNGGRKIKTLRTHRLGR